METLVIAGGILIGCFLSLSWFAGSDAPYIPTKTQRIRKILKLTGVKNLPAGRQGGQIFWELGSGDGRVVLEAAKMGAISSGVEQSLLRVLWSRWMARNLKNAHFIHGDIFSVIPANAGIQKADFIFIFLLPKGVNKLEPILKRTLKKGARVITQTFHFKNWKPYKKVFITDKNQPNTLLGKNEQAPSSGGKYEGDFWIYKN